MAVKIDEVLRGNRRRLRTCPEKLLMDASGLRLWADYMDAAPGFSGRIDFIHKINLPGLFFVECFRGNAGAGEEYEKIEEFEPLEVRWEPSSLRLHYERDGIEWTEYKFITREDAAVSVLEWKNHGALPYRVRLYPVSADGCLPTTYGERLAVSYFCNGQRIFLPSRMTSDCQGEASEGSCAQEGTQMRGKEGERLNPLSGEALPERNWYVHPGQTLKLCVAAQVCLFGERERMEAGCDRIRHFYCEGEKALASQRAEYQKWFDQVPGWRSSDPLLDRTWAYRWYIYRHSMMDPGIGHLKELFFCEGRSHKMTKEPFRPSGWEFSKLIPLSVPMHLLDLRWYGEKQYGNSVLHVMRDNQDEEGEFRCAKVDWQGNPYANFFGWSVWQYYLVSGDAALAREALPVLKRQAAGWRKRYGNRCDTLLTQYVHQLTGMEYQPSYWYFHDFPLDCRDEGTYTPVKRVDRNVYYYLNVQGIACLCRVCQDGEEEDYRTLAAQIRRDILEKMWDEDTGYFYDLHYQTNEKAFVKNIVGVFPLFGGFTEARHRKCLEALQSEAFDTPCPFPSVSTDCPVYTEEGGWRGQFFKGRNGCIWDGPTWPFADSIVLDAIGQESQRSGHSLDGVFRKYFQSYTRMHYYGGDGATPYLVEHYNSRTGECISDEVDYNHSYYIDLVVKYIAGVALEEEGLTVDPLDFGLEYFALENLKLRGRRVDIILEKESGELLLKLDGAVAAKRKGLGKLSVKL